MMNAKVNTPKKSLHPIFNVIEEIVSLIIAIGLLFYTNLFAKDQDKSISLLLNGILLNVGLIAFSNLRDRLYRFRKIQKTVDDTRKEMQKSFEDMRKEIKDRTIYKETGADEFFAGPDRKLYADLLSEANTIFISGITLSGTIQTYRSTLRERLEAGSHIKIMMIDPDSDEALKQLVKRSWSDVATPDYYKGSIRFISELIENIGNTQHAKGSLEIGFLPFVPSFGMKILERENVSKMAFIEIYHHLSDASPCFLVDETAAPGTYQLYKKQFDIMWGACKVHKIA
jgi:hypothetical protein